MAAISDSAITAAAEVVDSPQIAEAVQDVLDNAEPAAKVPAGTTEITRTEAELFRGGEDDDDDDDDEAMPEIDMGESDDDDEGEDEA